MSAAAIPEIHSPEWHAERATGIGSSEIATIAGIGRFGSRYRIWLEKTGRLIPDEREATEAMVTGRELEPWLARQFEKRTGLFAAGEQMMLRHPSKQWARTTIDAVLFESEVSAEQDTLDDAVAALELKYDDKGGPWCRDCGPEDVCPHDVVPHYYAAQAQWHMFVGGWPCCFFGVLHSFGRYRVYRLDRNDADITALVEAGEWFWDLVQTDMPPPVDGSQDTTDAIAKAYGSSVDEAVSLDGLADTISLLRTAKTELKRQGEAVAEMENVIRAALGEAEVGLVDGRPAVTWKPRTTTRLDTRLLRELHPDIAEAFELTTTTRTLLLKDPK